jgi:hypothetical protein
MFEASPNSKRNKRRAHSESPQDNAKQINLRDHAFHSRYGMVVEQRHPLTIKEARLCLASLRRCMHLKEFSKDYTL